VAKRFSEEDLARFMQIMLRTHGELGYKQEQRFHLELGLLKLVHAQRLLPLEELLSGGAAQPKAAASRASGKAPGHPARTTTPTGRGSGAPRAVESDSRAPAASPFARPSPFEADRSRKSEPKAEAAAPIAKSLATLAVSAPIYEASATASSAAATAVAEQMETPAEAQEELSAEILRTAVLAGLEDAGQSMLAHNLEEAEWSVRGIEVCAKVAMSQVLIDIALGAEPKKIVQAALSKASQKPLKFKMVSGGTASAAKANGNATPRPTNGAGARSRAASDPIVQRMREKFGAEIRTVIDQKDRG
jgi:DNA polymerase-3 subunit gamma/tau